MKGTLNMKAIKKSTICLAIIFALLVGMVPIRAHAADPFWGATYRNSNVNSFDIYVDVNRSVSRYTLKTWDFTGDVFIEAVVYNPNGVRVSSNVTYINKNEEVAYQLLTNGSVNGKYRVHCTVLHGSGAGWVGAWIY